MKKILMLLFFCTQMAFSQDWVNNLFQESWILSIGLNNSDEVYFTDLTSNSQNNLYLRRFDTGGFYVDNYSNNSLMVFDSDKNKYQIIFDESFSKFQRVPSQIPISYERISLLTANRYEGDWLIGTPPINVEIRKMENKDWEFILFFPGDPLTIIRRGYYPFYEHKTGVYRSSGIYPDSYIELSFEEETDSIKLTPLFENPDFPPEIFDPVRIWKYEKENN